MNEHGVHSPFVFDLLMNVIYNRNDFYCYRSIENVREQLLNSKKVISVIKQTGDRENKTSEKKVRQITKQFSKSPKYTQLLFRLVNHFQPPQIIELGTSVGISTTYMATADSKIEVITMEENQEIAEIAKQNFKLLKLKNIEQKIGSFAHFLQYLLSKNPNLYFVFFGENNCKQGTLNYFYLCLKNVNEASIFVFTDMYSSPEMKEAWDKIKDNNQVTVTIDLFFMGIVFFRKEQVKQHFVIKY